jgi:hypothetical protein
MAWLTAEGVSSNERAAFAKLPASTARTSNSIRRNRSIEILDFLSSADYS